MPVRSMHGPLALRRVNLRVNFPADGSRTDACNPLQTVKLQMTLAGRYLQS